MTIRNKTDEIGWSDSISNWDWYVGDIVIGLDPQERCGEDTYAVYEIVEESLEQVKHRGLFWTEKDAKQFADQMHE